MRTQLIEFSIFIMTMITVIGCGKEHDVNPPILRPEYLVIDTSSINYYSVNKINKVVYASLFGSNLTDYKINLNNDSIDDIEFSCSVYHHTVYDEWSASINILNKNVGIDIEQDTVLYASYSQKYYNSWTKDSITNYYKENYSKTKQYPSNVSITKKIENYPLVHSIGDTLNKHNNWKSGCYTLEFDDHSSGIQTNIQTGIWRNIDRKFIGVRLSEKDNVYYGWIELGVTGYRITLYRYGLNNEIKKAATKGTNS